MIDNKNYLDNSKEVDKESIESELGSYAIYLADNPLIY